MSESAPFVIRKATEADAEAIIEILEGIASERIYTAINPWWRRRGIGEALFESTLVFARLGFRECGRLTRQVRIGEQEEDEILMEFFL